MQLFGIWLLFGLLALVVPARGWPEELVRVGVFDHPPLVSVDAAGKPGGIFVEVLEQAAALEGWRLAYVPGSFQSCLERLAREEIDLLVSFTPTEERKARFDFTREPVISSWTQVYSAPGIAIATLADLDGRRVAGMAGDIHFQTFREAAAGLGIHPIPVEAESDLAAFESLARGAADALVTEYFAGLRREKGFSFTRTPVHLFPHPIGYGVKQGRLPHLIDALDRRIAAQRDDPASGYHAAIRRWLGSDYAAGVAAGRQVDRPRPGLLTEEELDWLELNPHIRFIAIQDQPPFSMRGPNGDLIGVLPDVFAELSRLVGQKLELEPNDDPGAWRARSKEPGIYGNSSAMLPSPVAGEYLFTSPFLSTPFFIYTTRGNLSRIRNIGDLAGLKIATPKGHLASAAFLDGIGGVTQVVAESPLDQFRKVLSGEADALVGYVTYPYLINKYLMTDLTIAFVAKEEVGIRIAVNRDRPELHRILDKAIAGFTEKRRSTILAKWTRLAGAAENLRLTEEERVWLDRHPVIPVAVDPNWAPLEYLDEQGRLQGISGDYLKRLGDMLYVRFEPVEGLAWGEAVEEVKSGRLAMFSSVRRSPEREGYLDFTEPYFSVPIVFFTGPQIPFIGDPRGLAGRKVAVVQGYAIQELLARDYPEIAQVPVEDIPEGLRRLAAGEVDAFADNILSGGYHIRKLGLNQIKVAGQTPYFNEQAMAARKDEPLLASILRKGLAAIPEEERNAIYQRWVAVRYEQTVDYELLWKSLAGAGLLLALFAYWVRRLQGEVARRRAVEEALRHTAHALETARDAAETANRAKSAFLANMSHELRTPLNAILGFSQFLAREPDIAPRHREMLGTINRAGGHLLTMVNEVLDLSKIEAGKAELRLASFDWARMLTDLGEMFRFRALGKGLAFDLQVEEGGPVRVRADEGKLRQVLINLLGNAVKFTRTGGVTLRACCVAPPPALAAEGEAAAPPHRLTVEVEDSGAGISPGELDRLFEPFVQLSSAAAGDHKGSGLGLAITHSFILLMGGKIEVASLPGQGTRFRLEVPVEPAEPGAATAASRPAVAVLAPGQGEQRILVVDDEADNRTLLAGLLNQAGFTVREAADGAEALEEFQGWSPHFIWLDLRMPVLDGYETARRLRALPGGDRVRVAAITANALREERERALAAGCDDLIAKPYQADEVFRIMERQLNLRYRYRETDAEVAPAQLLEPESFAPLPAELVRELLEAVLRLDQDEVVRVNDAVRRLSPPLAEGIRALAEQFRFERLLELCERALENR